MGREVGFAVDISNWSGYIAQTHVKRWVAAGVKRVIVGTQREAIMRQQMHQIYGEKVHLEAYVYLYDNYTAFADQVKEAIRRFEDFPVERLWLDCEFATTAPPDVVVERIQRAVDACETAGIPYGIYTGQWWWVPTTDNSVAFMHEDLWFASYRTPLAGPNESQSLVVGFGAWTKGLMRQYRGTVYMAGVSVDYNWFEEEIVDEKFEALQRAYDKLEEDYAELGDDYAALQQRFIASIGQRRAMHKCAVACGERVRALEEGMRALLA